MGGRLGERDARAAWWDGKDYKKPFGDGLYLQVRRFSKSWYFRDRRNGGERFNKIGDYPAVPVKAARAKVLTEALEDAPDTMSVQRLAERYRDEVAAFNLKSTDPLQGYIDRGIRAPRKIPDFGQNRGNRVDRRRIGCKQVSSTTKIG